MIFSVLNKVIFWLNVAAALALAISYVAPYVNPNVFWPLPFFGLAYPVILIVNLVFLVYWLLRAKLWILLSLAPLIFGVNHIFKYVQWNSKKEVNKEKCIKILSMNVGGFEERNVGNESNVGLDKKFLEYIHESDPDFLIFQEFSSGFLFDGKKAAVSISNALTHKSYHKFRDEEQAQVIFSRYPILRSGEIDFSEMKTTNGAMWIDVKRNNDTLRIYNIHLQSFSLNNQISMDKINTSEEAVSESKNIVKRIRDGNGKRALQVKLLMEHFKSSPYKIILAGDFNDSPMSFTYREFTKSFNDAFMDAAFGFGSTYVGPYPSYRIDYIMSSPEIKAKSFVRGPNFVSDHRLIISDLEVE